MMEEVLAAIKEERYNSLKDILDAWMEEAGVPCVQVRIGYGNATATFFIYTNHPGLMIGYHGELVDKYKEKLKEYSMRNVEVEFIETQYSFIFKKD